MCTSRQGTVASTSQEEEATWVRMNSVRLQGGASEEARKDAVMCQMTTALLVPRSLMAFQSHSSVLAVLSLKEKTNLREAEQCSRRRE